MKLEQVPVEKSIEVNTHQPYLAQVVFETQIGRSWQGTQGKCYYTPVLFFSRHLLLATDRKTAWLDGHLVRPSTATLYSYDNIHLHPELILPLHIQMKDKSETVEVAQENSFNTGISFRSSFCLYLPLQLS